MFIKNTMKRKFKEVWFILLLAIVVSIVILVWVLFNKSDETIIINGIQSITNENKTLQEEINIQESTIKINELRINCLTQQLNRRIEWLEYSIEYCSKEENLNKFTGL